MLETYNVKVGSIFVASWGYEQTNVNAYQVIECKGKSTVLLKEISLETVEQTSFNSEYVRPVKDSFFKEEIYRKRINKHGSLQIDDVRYASLYNGGTYHSSWGY